MQNNFPKPDAALRQDLRKFLKIRGNLRSLELQTHLSRPTIRRVEAGMAVQPETIQKLRAVVPSKN